MFFILLFAIVFSNGSIYAAACHNKKYGEVLPITLFSFVITVYFFGLFGFLRQGVYFACMIAFALYAVSIAKVVKEKNFKTAFSNIITPASIFLCVICAIFISGTLGMKVFQWDELSHWASCVKRMYVAGEFYSNPSLNALFQSYPPAMAVLQYGAMVLKGEYAEWVLYLCYAFFSLALFMPFFEKMQHRTVVKNAVLMMSVIMVIISLEQEAFVKTYIDLFLSLLVAFLAAYLFCFDCVNDRLSNLTFACGAAVLVLTKDAGMFFAIAMVIAFVASYLLENKGRIKEFGKAEWLNLSLPFAAMLIAKLSWSAHLRISGSVARFDGKYSIPEFIGILFGKDVGYKTAVKENFADMFFNSYPSTDNYFSVDYGFLVCCALLALFALVVIYNQKSKEGALRRNTVLATLCISSVIYIIGTLASYIYKFTEYEASILASYSRYMLILLITLVVCAFLTAIYMLSQTNKYNWIYLLVAVYMAVALVNSNYVKQLTGKVFINRSIEMTQEYQELVEKVDNLNLSDERVAVVAQGDSGYIGLMLTYCLYPVEVDTSFGYSPVFQDSYSAREYAEDLINNDYQYLILYKTDNLFAEQFSDVFENPDDISAKGVYYINPETKTLSLVI